MTIANTAKKSFSESLALVTASLGWLFHCISSGHLSKAPSNLEHTTTVSKFVWLYCLIAIRLSSVALGVVLPSEDDKNATKNREQSVKDQEQSHVVPDKRSHVDEHDESLARKHHKQSDPLGENGNEQTIQGDFLSVHDEDFDRISLLVNGPSATDIEKAEVNMALHNAEESRSADLNEKPTQTTEASDQTNLMEEFTAFATGTLENSDSVPDVNEDVIPEEKAEAVMNDINTTIMGSVINDTKPTETENVVPTVVQEPEQELQAEEDLQPKQEIEPEQEISVENPPSADETTPVSNSTDDVLEQLHTVVEELQVPPQDVEQTPIPVNTDAAENIEIVFSASDDTFTTGHASDLLEGIPSEITTEQETQNAASIEPIDTTTEVASETQKLAEQQSETETLPISDIYEYSATIQENNSFTPEDEETISAQHLPPTPPMEPEEDGAHVPEISASSKKRKNKHRKNLSMHEHKSIQQH